LIIISTFDKNIVMSTAELKQSIFYKLTSIDDENLLNQIHILLKDIEIDVKPYKLNKEQLKMVNESETDYLLGRVHSNESVFKEDQQWLESL
jgi:hypothetical protein